MDRSFTYLNQLRASTAYLQDQKNAMLGIGGLAAAVLGVGPAVSGLACTATSPASMSVTIGTGSLYVLATIDAIAFGDLGVDNGTTVKQGLLSKAVTAACPAPTTSGQSIVYLVEAAYADQDAGNQALTYFNTTNPAQPYTGQGNNGAAQPTVRQGVCSVLVTAGTPATTGTAVPPAVTNGYSALYYVTVPYGATTITASNISVVPGAPFIGSTLPALALSTLQAANNLSDLANLPAALANLGFAFQPGTSGLLKMPNVGGQPGVIFQWGYTLTNSSGQAVVTFSETYPTNLFRVLPVPIGVAGAGTYANGGTTMQSNSGFTQTIGNSQTGANAPAGVLVDFYAIGN